MERTNSHDRMLGILDAFDIEHARLSLSEIARSTALPLTTAHRLVGRLQDWGALERDPDGRYVIGHRLAQLGVLSPHAFQQRARLVPFLEQLFITTREQVVLSAFHPGGTIVIEQILGWRESSMSAGLGERLPLHATSPGLIYLAFGPPDAWATLERTPVRRFTPRTLGDGAALRLAVQNVRRTALALSDGGFIEGMASLSAPVFGHRGTLYGAVSVVWTSSEAEPAAFEKPLIAAGHRMSAALRSPRESVVPHPVRRGVAVRPSRAGNAS